WRPGDELHAPVPGQQRGDPFRPIPFHRRRGEHRADELLRVRQRDDHGRVPALAGHPERDCGVLRLVHVGRHRDLAARERDLASRMSGGSWSLYAAPLFLTEGRHTLDYHATDIAGLSDIGHSVSVKVDTTKPVSPAAASGTPGNNGWYVTLATLVLNASDLT